MVKGGAEEVNEQLKTLWGLGQNAASSGSKKARAKVAMAETDAESSEECAAPQQAKYCSAPEQWPDVGRLEEWGVPKYAAPGLLGAWRRAHRDGAHELCDLWADLAEHVQARIPFVDAFDLAMANWLADCWNFGSLKTITELYRLYRPWEGTVHRKVYLDEVCSAIDSWSGEGGTEDVHTVLEGLPRRFLHGLPRRFGHNGHSERNDDDD